MTKLQKPKFDELNQGNGAGSPVLKALWEKFELSLLLTQCGMNKHSGVSAWIIVFAYVIGLVRGCTSVAQMASHACEDKILKLMLSSANVAQYSMSRFFTKNYNWHLFSKKRFDRLQQESETALKDGDTISLDDTKVAHPHGKKIPFLCWLYDSSDKINIWCMNLVATFAVLQNGLEYPIYNRIWRKSENNISDKRNKNDRESKIELAKQMLTDIREFVNCRLWVAMDRWFLCKELFLWLQERNYDWVTKAKKNTALYRMETEKFSGRIRMVPVKPSTLIMEVFFRLLKNADKGAMSAIEIKNIYMKMPREVLNKKGKFVKKQEYVPIAAIAVMKLTEDIEKTDEELEKRINDTATFRNAHLLISNKVDAPEEAVKAYVRRWRIEVFFRTAKQELGLAQCHSTSEAHHNAHIELLFTAETLLSYAKWELNDKDKSVEGSFTHGQMVNCFFNAQYSIDVKTKNGITTMQIYFDIDVRCFARLLEKLWPDDYRLSWLPIYQILARSA